MTHQIRGKHQIALSRSTQADAISLWKVLSDSRRLPEWIPAVRHVDRCEVGGEVIGAVRHCNVELAGRQGELVEECVDLVPRVSITYAVVSDTLGMSRMFRDYCFRISLGPEAAGTAVRIDTYYTPRNALSAFMNAIMMRRQFRKVVADILEGLCQLAESETESSGLRP